MATLTQIRTKTNAAVNAEFDRNPDGSPRARMLTRLETRLYLAALRGSWPTTPQPSEQGTTPEELATIVAEETERAMGEATRDQWDQDD